MLLRKKKYQPHGATLDGGQQYIFFFLLNWVTFGYHTYNYKKKLYKIFYSFFFCNVYLLYIYIYDNLRDTNRRD